jgi:hypothetical protein
MTWKKRGSGLWGAFLLMLALPTGILASDVEMAAIRDSASQHDDRMAIGGPDRVIRDSTLTEIDTAAYHYNPLWQGLTTLNEDHICNLAGTFQGVNLSQIQLVIDGTSAAIYWNQFFEHIESKELFQKYSHRDLEPLPTPLSDDPPYTVPGRSSADNGLHHIYASLRHVSCSSKFGGSLRFRFQLDEDYEFEVQSDVYLWDLSGLIIDLYYVPDPTAINTGRSWAIPVGSIHVELTAIDPVAYDRGSLAAGMLSDPDLQALDQVLDDAAAGLASKVHLPLMSLAYGLIHDHFQDRLPTSTHVVRMMELGDGHIEIYTHEREKGFIVSYRILSIEGPGDDFTIETDAAYGACSANAELVRLGQVTFRSDGGPSRWFQIGDAMRFEQCGNAACYFGLDLLLIERDVIYDQLYYTSAAFRADTDVCEALEELADAGSWGQGIGTTITATSDDDDWTVSIEMRASVVLR